MNYYTRRRASLLSFEPSLRKKRQGLEVADELVVIDQQAFVASDISDLKLYGAFI